MGYSYNRIYEGLENTGAGNDVAAVTAWFERNPERDDDTTDQRYNASEPSRPALLALYS